MKFSREQWAEAGFVRPATKPSMKRRAHWHDYAGTGLYLVTLVVRDRRPLLGRLVGEPRPRVELSELGRQVLERARLLPDFNSNMELFKIQVMPDHIHMILYVSKPFEGRGKNLGSAIAGFKTGCNRAYRALAAPTAATGKAPAAPAATEKAPAATGAATGGSLFEEGFNDRILTDGEVLQRWKDYLDDNPRRLWIKRNRREVFTVLRGREVGGCRCQMIGNQFLLDSPDKAAVIVHRRDSEEEFGRLFARWMAMAERGTILVSAAIAPREKIVMRAAMDAGYPIILLRENGFGLYYKPSGRSFDACADGRLLQISPWEYHTDKRLIKREQCLFLNDLATRICNPSTPRQAQN